MRMAVTGASGLIGTAVCAALAGEGHEVIRLVRGQRSARTRRSGTSRPARSTSRASRTSARSSTSRARTSASAGPTSARPGVLDSRVDGTRLIAETAARLPSGPVLVCASAVGYYGTARRREARRELAAGHGLPRGARRGLGGCGGARPQPPGCGRCTCGKGSCSRAAAARWSACSSPSSSASEAGSAAAGSGGAGSRSTDAVAAYRSRSRILSRGLST